MGHVKNFWRKLTHTKALEQCSGKLEMIFFESVYRITYLAGLSSHDHDVPYLLYSNLVKLTIVLLVCGELWYSFSDASGLDEIAASINATVIQFITIYRYKNMLYHKNIYNKLATAMKSPYFDVSTKKRQDLVNYWARQNQKYLKLLLALGNCTLIAWYIYPLVDELDYNLIIGIRLPFKYNTPHRYPLAYMLVVVAFAYISHFVMVTDLIMQAHLMHLLCQFTVLADCFENILIDCQTGLENIHKDELIYNKKFCAKYMRRLGNLVEQHKLILSIPFIEMDEQMNIGSYIYNRNTMNLRDTLSGPMLGQLAASATLICFVGFQTVTTITESIAKCLMSFLFLGYNAFELYMLCRWSEEITIQSKNVAEAIYCSGWERGVSLLPGVRSTIIYVMARASKPIVLTAGGMYNLSLTSYTTLVKTSYSALTVLLRFRHD